MVGNTGRTTRQVVEAIRLADAGNAVMFISSDTENSAYAARIAMNHGGVQRGIVHFCTPTNCHMVVYGVDYIVVDHYVDDLIRGGRLKSLRHVLYRHIGRSKIVSRGAWQSEYPTMLRMPDVFKRDMKAWELEDKLDGLVQLMVGKKVEWTLKMERIVKEMSKVMEEIVSNYEDVMTYGT